MNRHWNGTIAWKIPAKTIRAWGFTFNFNEGCNLCRAETLKDVHRALTTTRPIRRLSGSSMGGDCSGEWGNQAHPILVSKRWLSQHRKDEYPEPTIEIKVDGKSISVDGNYKQGMIKGFMANYCRPGEGKIKIVSVNNAYRKLKKQGLVK